MACVGASACLGSITEAGVSAATGANRSSSPGEAALREKARMDDEAKKPPEPAAACIDGTVSSTGPLGSGLARVRVELEGEAVGEGPEVVRSAQTDARGEFHLCIARAPTPVPAQALGVPPYRDRTFKVTIRFAREGYRERSVDRTIETGSRPERLDVYLDRVTSDP